MKTTQKWLLGLLAAVPLVFSTAVLRAQEAPADNGADNGNMAVGSPDNGGDVGGNQPGGGFNRGGGRQRGMNNNNTGGGGGPGGIDPNAFGGANRRGGRGGGNTGGGGNNGGGGRFGGGNNFGGGNFGGGGGNFGGGGNGRLPQEFAALDQMSIFSKDRHVQTEPVIRQVQPRPAGASPVFTGVVTTAQDNIALLEDSTKTPAVQPIRVGESLPEGKVTEITLDKMMLLDSDGKTLEIDLGHNLRGQIPAYNPDAYTSTTYYSQTAVQADQQQQQNFGGRRGGQAFGQGGVDPTAFGNTGFGNNGQGGGRRGGRGGAGGAGGAGGFVGFGGATGAPNLGTVTPAPAVPSLSPSQVADVAERLRLRRQQELSGGAAPAAPATPETPAGN